MALKNFLRAAAARRRERPAAPVSITRLLLPSCLTILLSMTCFIAATWAWFTANQTCAVTAIQAGSVWVESGTAHAITTTQKFDEYIVLSEGASVPEGKDTISNEEFVSAGLTEGKVATADPPTIVVEDNNNLMTLAGGVGTFSVSAGRRHQVSATINGTVSGYCVVTITPIADPTQTLYTLCYQPDVDGKVSFELLLAADCIVTVEASWGTPGTLDDQSFSNTTETINEDVHEIYVLPAVSTTSEGSDNGTAEPTSEPTVVNNNEANNEPTGSTEGASGEPSEPVDSQTTEE